jgi:hypothetical protein|tara:strand:+ start:613 stop:843 length:231 start_codon:yes stop_codon:yes gene_type:complete
VISKEAKQDLQEINVNMILGLIINGWLTYLIFETTPKETVGITLIFFAVSYLRQWVIRVLYRHIEKRKRVLGIWKS